MRKEISLNNGWKFHKGDIDVKGPVIVDTSAIVLGNIKSKSVQINNGAVLEGYVSQCYSDNSPKKFFGEK